MFRIFGGDRIKGMMGMFQIDDLPIESGLLVRPLLPFSKHQYTDIGLCWPMLCQLDAQAAVCFSMSGTLLLLFDAAYGWKLDCSNFDAWSDPDPEADVHSLYLMHCPSSCWPVCMLSELCACWTADKGAGRGTTQGRELPVW